MNRVIIKVINYSIVKVTLITLAILTLAIFSAKGLSAQSDPIGKLLKEGLERVPESNGTARDKPGTTSPSMTPGSEYEKKGPVCEEGWECIHAGGLIKGNYDKENKHFNVASQTRNANYDRISIRQRIGETHGVIVNTIKVGRQGKWKSYDQGQRLPEGRTLFDIPVPQNTPELVLSVDHGRGARIRLVLERRLP